MEQNTFKQYKRELNHRRENKLKSLPKLSPKVILSDDLFDVSINDIPMNIKPPVLPVQKEQSNKTSKELW